MGRLKIKNTISAEVVIKLKTCDIMTEESLELNHDGDFTGLILRLVENRGIFDLLEGELQVVSIKKIAKKAQ